MLVVTNIKHVTDFIAMKAMQGSTKKQKSKETYITKNELLLCNALHY